MEYWGHRKNTECCNVGFQKGQQANFSSAYQPLNCMQSLRWFELSKMHLRFFPVGDKSRKIPSPKILGEFRLKLHTISFSVAKIKSNWAQKPSKGRILQDIQFLKCNCTSLYVWEIKMALGPNALLIVAFLRVSNLPTAIWTTFFLSSVLS